MEFKKSGRFFPNECYICQSTKNLKRCDCNMISYCGEDHRLQHLSVHESFCKVIMELLKEKGVSHIYEELFPLLGYDWDRMRKQIYEELEKKSKKSLSPLEQAMFHRPRVCFVCRQYKQEELSNCPGCPIASFCKQHSTSAYHEKNCSLMRKYLNLLTTADNLSVDLQFLPSCFPFIGENSNIKVYPLIDTVLIRYAYWDEHDTSQLRESNIHLLDFISTASKFHTALQKIYDTVPSEIVIHLDALHYQHPIVEKNYWEFLLHLNPDLQVLKIVITGSQDPHDFEISLCQKCRSMEKQLSVEIYSTPYEEYMLQECYQKPNVLIYCRLEDGRKSQQTNRWSQVDCPVILPIDSEKNFYETKNILEFLSAKYQIIYNGQLCTPFSNKSLKSNDDYVIIFKLKETKSRLSSVNSKFDEMIDKEIRTNEIQSPSVSQDVDSKGDDSKTEQLENEREIESQDENAAANKVDNNKLEPEENEADSQSQDAAKKVENTDQKPENCNKSLSPSSSVSSFVIIPELGNDESNAKEVNKEFESAGNKSVPEFRIDDCNDSYAEEKEDTTVDPGKSNHLEEIHEKDKQSRVTGIDYLEKYISFLKNENEELRQHVSASVEEITKLQNKNLELQEICSKLVEKNKLIKETVDVIDELGKNFG